MVPSSLSPLPPSRRHDAEVLEPEQHLIDPVAEAVDAIGELVKQNNLFLVIDLGKVNHLNSTALGVLVETHTNYVKRGGSVKLCALEKRISNLLLITKLSMVFEVHDSLEDALASFASRA